MRDKAGKREIPRFHFDKALAAATSRLQASFRPGDNDIEKHKLLVDDALRQTFESAERLSRSHFSRREQNSLLITTYQVYGRYYTRITMTNHPTAGLIWEAEPWQFVFEQLALADGRAPFLYRLCELAVGLQWIASVYLKSGIFYHVVWQIRVLPFFQHHDH